MVIEEVAILVVRVRWHRCAVSAAVYFAGANQQLPTNGQDHHAVVPGTARTREPLRAALTIIIFTNDAFLASGLKSIGKKRVRGHVFLIISPMCTTHCTGSANGPRASRMTMMTR